jgi:hypothetical protein
MNLFLNQIDFCCDVIHLMWGKSRDVYDNVQNVTEIYHNV